MFKKKRGDTKLDLLLKEGASKDKKKVTEMDKAVASTTHRLLREKIQFAKASVSVNVAEQYKQSGFILLAPQDEQKATERVKNCMKTFKKPTEKSNPKKRKKQA